MIKINFKTNKELNFLMVLYQKIKKQNSFENLSFKKTSLLDKEDKKLIKSIIRNNNNFLEGIKRSGKLNLLYNENKKIWGNYWKENYSDLLDIMEKLRNKSKDYDFSIFKKVGAFFDFKGPEEIDLYICVGNETGVGTGNAFPPSFTVIFPRNFKKYSDKLIKADFAVLIHEVMHLHQNVCEEKDKNLREEVAKCFAPRGILINEEKFKGNVDFYNKVKKSFEKGNTYKKIREDLIKLSDNTLLGDE